MTFDFISYELVNAVVSFVTLVIFIASAIAAVISLHHSQSFNQISAVLVMEREMRTPEMQEAFRFVQSELPFKLHNEEFRAELATPGFIDSRVHLEITACNWFNAMGTDQANGRFDLDDNGNLTLGYNYPAPALHPIFTKLTEVMQAMTEAMGGDYVPFPLWKGLADRKLVTIFPLGGCPMGPTSTEGVVDATGRVFNTSRGSQAIYPGLYVTDASIIPGPLAVQPTLTIVALALKAAAAMRNVPQ